MSRLQNKDSRPTAAAGERQLRAWIQLAGLLLLAAMAAPFFAGLVYTHDDLGEFHLPTRDFYARQLSHGEAFDWMPSLYSGFYLTGEGQVGSYHPLHWLLYRVLPLGAAFDLELLLNYPYLFAGTYLLLRRLVDRKAAALFGAFAFTFSGFSLLHFVHPNAIAVVAHVPWLLWTIDVGLQRKTQDEFGNVNRRQTLAVVAIALLTGSQLLLGYPQYVWFSLLAEAGFCIWRKNVRALVWVAAAKICGLIIGAVQILPTLDMLGGSTRQVADAEFAASGSLAPLNLVQLVAPYLFRTRVVGGNTHELGLYAGAVPLVLCVWLLANRRRWGKYRQLVRATLVLATVSLALAFGSFTPFYALQSYLPLVNHFRFPCRAIVLFHLAIAIGAAVAFAMLCRRAEKADANSAKSFKVSTPLCASVVASVSLAIIGPLLWPDYVAAPLLIWCGPLLVAIAAALLVVATRGKRAALVALILLAAVDQGVYGLSYAIGSHVDDLNQFARSAILPPATRADRIAADLPSAGSRAPRVGNRMLLAGAQRIDGYAGLEPSKQLDYCQADTLRLAGVHWVRRTDATEKIPGLVPHDQHWLSVPNPLARVRLVTRALDSKVAAERDVEADAARVDEPLDLLPGTPGVAKLVADSPGHLFIRTNAPTRQLLVVAESFHLGWRARCNGRCAPVMRVDGDFLGCVVTPGASEVELEFRPQSLEFGKKLAACGLALMLCLGIARSRSRW